MSVTIENPEALLELIGDYGDARHDMGDDEVTMEAYEWSKAEADRLWTKIEAILTGTPQPDRKA